MYRCSTCARSETRKTYSEEKWKKTVLKDGKHVPDSRLKAAGALLRGVFLWPLNPGKQGKMSGCSGRVCLANLQF